MIVGYPSGYYDFWERERNQLHATRGGEPTYTIFESSFESVNPSEQVENNKNNTRRKQQNGLGKQGEAKVVVILRNKVNK